MPFTLIKAIGMAVAMVLVALLVLAGALSVAYLMLFDGVGST